MSIITVSQKANCIMINKARQIGNLLDIPFIERQNLSIEALKEQYKVENVLVMTNAGPKLCTNNELEHKFHLSMAQLRLLKLHRGGSDYLLEAVGEDSLESFLDCTAGLASDSIIVAYGHPECKNILALEGKKELAYITNYGLRHFVHKDELITNALRRIRLVSLRYEDLLVEAKDKSIEVIYFDPMFASPVNESPQFLPLRGYTIETAFSRDTLNEALRVARKKVIVKERPFSSIFKNFPPTRLVGGKYSRIIYGVYEV